MASLLPLLKCPFHQAVLGTTLAAATGLFLLLRPAPHLRPATIVSPRTGLAELSSTEIARLPYPPDMFPGGRWVDTPYGMVRVYEWGAETGRKVVFIHGVGTPCCVARDLLWELADAGCRVMTFDLYGRGYSDTPVDTPHDARLYSTQLLCVLASSSLHWSSFTLIGYSFGGGLAVAVAATFPRLVAELILLAPCGVLQASRLGVMGRLANAGWVPDAAAAFLARRRTHAKPSAEVLEAGRRKADPKDRSVVLDVEAVVEWQAASHAGFVTAFLSSFRNGPLFDRQAEWRRVGARWRRDRKRCLVVVAEQDEVVDAGLLAEMVGLLGGGEAEAEGEAEGEGAGRVRGRVIGGVGHDFVVRRGREVAAMVAEFWKAGGDRPEGWTDVQG